MADLAPVTHVAGADVVIGGRRLRQRCSWCGAVLLDYDLTRVAVALEPCRAECDHGKILVPPGDDENCPRCGGTGHEEPGPPATYPVGRLVRVVGGGGFRMNEVLDETDQLPDDACANVHDEVTA